MISVKARRGSRGVAHHAAARGRGGRRLQWLHVERALDQPSGRWREQAIKTSLLAQHAQVRHLDNLCFQQCGQRLVDESFVDAGTVQQPLAQWLERSRPDVRREVAFIERAAASRQADQH